MDSETTLTSSGQINTFEFTKKDGSAGQGFNIADENGTVYTTFSSTVKDIFNTQGVQRKIKYKETQKGQYINYNITDVANESGEFEEKGKSYKGGGFGGKADPQKTASIERQTALKCAVDILVPTMPEGHDPDPENIIALAKDLHSFIRGDK